VHYTMGGIETNPQCETSIAGLYAAGECASVGLHGANRLGSNSLTELLVFGRLAGEQASKRAAQTEWAAERLLEAQGDRQQAKLLRLCDGAGSGENWVELKRAMVQAMESGCGIYRTEEGMRHSLETMRQLRARFNEIRVKDTSKIFNTELLECIELGYGLDIAEASCLSALERRESRGAHQRLDEGMQKRDDVNYLKHSQVFYQGEANAELRWQDVDVRFSAPAERAYGDAGKGGKA